MTTNLLASSDRTLWRLLVWSVFSTPSSWFPSLESDAVIKHSDPVGEPLEMVIGNKDPVVAAATRNGTGKLSEDSPVDEAKADGFVEQEWHLFITGDSLSGEGERVNFMWKYVVKYSNGQLAEHVTFSIFQNNTVCSHWTRGSNKHRKWQTKKKKWYSHSKQSETTNSVFGIDHQAIKSYIILKRP